MRAATGTDASKVIVSGEGVKSGIVGREIKGVIDTRNAGPGRDFVLHGIGGGGVGKSGMYVWFRMDGFCCRV